MLDEVMILKSVAHAKERMSRASLALDDFVASKCHDKNALYEALQALEDQDGCLPEDIHDALRLTNEEFPEDWMASPADEAAAQKEKFLRLF